jgi:hypothetical protein
MEEYVLSDSRRMVELWGPCVHVLDYLKIILIAGIIREKRKNIYRGLTKYERDNNK